jgi:DnaJ-class molecular chaperone
MTDLPPGVSLRDVDGSDECPECGGSGQLESHDKFEVWYETCPKCGGTGVKGSTRGAKFTDDIREEERQ